MRRVPERSEPRVAEMSVQNRELLVIEAASFGSLPNVEGAIVWVEPPVSASHEEVQSYKRRLEDAGALRVKLLSSARPAEQFSESPARACTVVSVEGLRAIALLLVDEVAPELRDDVRAAVEWLLARASI